MSLPKVVITPGLSISFVGQSPAIGSPTNIITPGASTYTASAFLYEAYFPATVAGNTFAFNPIGVNYVPVVYVRNVDPINQLTLNLTTIGGGTTLTFQLTQNGFFFLFTPVSSTIGPGVGGIDSVVGLKVLNAASTGTCSCEIFMAV